MRENVLDKIERVNKAVSFEQRRCRKSLRASDRVTMPGGEDWRHHHRLTYTVV